MITDDELLTKLATIEEERTILWREVFRRGLAFRAIGIDPEKRCSNWVNPVITDKPAGGKIVKQKKEYDLTGLDDLEL